MKLCLPESLIGLCCLSIINGCSALGAEQSPAMPTPGLDNYSLSEQRARSGSGCQYNYRLFEPLTPTTTTSVILGHGFLRNQNTMTNAGRALANAGIRALTLDFCNMRPWNGHHQRNASDMRALAQQLGIDNDIIYAGFSAGALAAILASDDSTRAVLTLDLVDQNDLGRNAARHLRAPLIGLSGPASSCNAQGSGAEVFDIRPGSAYSDLTRINGVSHCEFESPTNWLCKLACGDDDSRQTNQLETDKIVRLIVRKLTPFLAALEP